METLVEKEERSDRYTLRSVGFLVLHHTLSAALSLERCSLSTSDSQGEETIADSRKGESEQRLQTHRLHSIGYK